MVTFYCDDQGRHSRTVLTVQHQVEHARYKIHCTNCGRTYVRKAAAFDELLRQVQVVGLGEVSLAVIT